MTPAPRLDPVPASGVRLKRLASLGPASVLVLATLAGAGGALAMAPLHLLPALVVSASAGVLLMDASVRRGGAGWTFATGWAFGFGFFLAGLWWLGAAFLVDGDLYLWALPLGVVALPAGLALFHGLAFTVARLFWPPDASPLRILVFAAALGLADWLRTFLFSGFPWNTYGQAAAGWLPLAQAVSLVGTEGLGVLLVAIAAAPAALAGTRPLVPLLCAAVPLAGLLAFGWLRLEGREPQAEVPGVRLRIVQPNVLQSEKNAPRSGLAVLHQHLALSALGPAAGAGPLPTHVIWPESVFPFLLEREPVAQAELARGLPPGVRLLTGAARGGDGRFYNSLVLVGPDGRIAASYDKVHLVPFGEYLPGGGFLERMGLRQFVRVPGGFSAGSGRQLLEVEGMPPVLPLICYEAIFSDELRDLASSASLMVNVTNDGWFGETFGPHQHFAQARLRAIEFGLPLVRSANTGISAVVDGYGVVLGRLEVGRSGHLDSPLPARLPPTPYSRLGAGVAPGMVTIAFACALIGGLRRRRVFGP